MRGRTTPSLRTALVGAAASVALVAGVGFVATTPDVATDDVHLVQAERPSLVQGQDVDIDLKKLVEAQIGQEIPEDTTIKLSGLPEGLKQDGWKITGKPAESGLYNVRVEVSSAGQTSTQDVQLMVAAPSGEEPNAPETGTETEAESGAGAESETGEDEKSGGDATESAEKDAEKSGDNAKDSEEAKTSTPSTTTPSDRADNKGDDDKGDDKSTEESTESEAGAGAEGTTTPSSTTEAEAGDDATDSTESDEAKFPTEEEAFGDGKSETADSEDEEGTEIDLDEATGSLTDGMGGSGSLEGSTGGDEGVETCDTGDLTEGLEQLLPVVVGDDDESGMITSIITSVLGTLLPTVLNTASSGNSSVCEAGGATGSLLESAAGFADAQQEGNGGEAAAATAGAQAAGGTTTLDSLLGGDGTQLIELMQLAGGIMEQVNGPAAGTR